MVSESASPSGLSAGLVNWYKGSSTLTRRCLWLLVYTLGAIVFGAYLRASFSGDGCGQNWPNCGDGSNQIVQLTGTTKAMIESLHRVSAQIILPLSFVLALWGRKRFPEQNATTKWLWWSVFFSITEGLVGFALVKFGLTAYKDSVHRTVVMSVHLFNTFLLLASMTGAVASSAMKERPKLEGQGGVGALLGFAGLCSFVLGISGAISALGTMLRTHDDVLAQALKPTADYLDRLRVLHPFIAVSTGAFLVLACGLIAYWRPTPQVRMGAKIMLGLYAFQFVFGLVNIWVKAPIAMQMAHLLLADVVWVTLIGMGYIALAQPTEEVTNHEKAPEEKPEKLSAKELLKVYIALTKPRIISLLLFTTVTAMFAAAKGWPGGWLIFWVMLGGYCSAGAANTINMIIERDTDGDMPRTSKRPTVTKVISTAHTTWFAAVLTVFSFTALWVAANLLAALLSLAGLLTYVIIYTMMLKRRTWQNIVWGGAAGCFPPLVGWAAVTGDLNPLALCLFGIVFMWTPVHFWALALLIKDDYAAAGIPMLPVVKGDRATVVQIMFYGLLTAIVSSIPLAQKQVGWLYFATVIALNFGLLVRCVSLLRTEAKPQARSLFKFSMAYLALLFLMVAIDRSVL